MSDNKFHHPFNTDKGWDERYTKYGESGAGTFVHSERGNLLFYRTKFRSVDQCLKKIKVSLENSEVLDAAGGSGKFIDFFLRRGCRNLLVTDFSQVALDKINQKYAGNQRVSTQFFDLKSPQSLWSDRFDFIFVMEAIFLLESDEQLEQAIRNFSESLKSGGYLIISDLFPDDKPIAVGDYVKHRTKKLYREILSKNGLMEIDYMPQTFLFNRNVFRRFQTRIERMGGLMFWLDRIAMTLGFTSPPQKNVKYIIAKKIPVRL